MDNIIFYGSPKNAGVNMPCKDCIDRSAECHSVCEKYKEAKEKCDKAREELHKKRDSYYILSRKKYHVRPTRSSGIENDWRR